MSMVIPEGFRYVGAALVSTVWLLVWQVTVVQRHRRKCGIAYPQLYAEKAETLATRDAFVFNCAQRAHQNTLEQMPIVAITTLVTGTKYPFLAAGACAFWAFTRVLFTIGYTSGDPVKRHTCGGMLGEIPLLGLLLGSVWVSYLLVIGA